MGKKGQRRETEGKRARSCALCRANHRRETRKESLKVRKISRRPAVIKRSKVDRNSLFS